MVGEIKIVAYLKPHCGWSKGVREVLKKYNLKYSEKDVFNNEEDYAEMVKKSGQPLSPCVEVNGHMLADVSGEEVEEYFVEKKLIKKSDKPTMFPTNSSCQDHEAPGIGHGHF